MTSKNLFFNLLKEDFRRRLWTFILSSLVFFGTFVVAFTMLLQNYMDWYDGYSYSNGGLSMAEKISQEICSDFYACYPWFMAVAVVGAVICGMSGFAYLHSRKQMDFYHGLPVKREVIFAVRFVNGILIYAIPYLVGLLYTFLLSAVFGVMTTDVFTCGLYCFVVHLMGYVMMYLGTVIAMLLTGKMVIGFFGTCVINAYAPAIYGLVILLKETFFVTNYINNVTADEFFSITRWFSPFSYYLSVVWWLMEDRKSALWKELLWFVLLASVLLAAALWIYKKRASEKADTAMSFKATEPVIRIMISVPVGIIVGFLFYEVQYNFDFAILWLSFGCLLGGFLAHGIIEALYQGDIRKCLSHKAQLLCTMVCAVAIPLMFLYDVFGYDSYLPEKKDIKSMAVVSSDLRFGGSYYTEQGYVSPQNYGLEKMEVTDIDTMYALAEILTKDAGENREDKFFGYRTVSENEGKVRYSNFVVRYTLQDGSEILRQYEYNFYAVEELLAQMYQDKEFKKATHPIFGLLESNHQLMSVECYAPTTGITVQLERNVERILQTYAEEVLELTYQELQTSGAIGELTAYFKVQAEGGTSKYEDASTYLVYPSMTRTIALLAEQGYYMQGIQDAVNVESITISYGGTINDLKYQLGMEVPEEEWYYEEDYVIYEKYGEYEQHVYPVTKESYQEISVTFTDPAEIEAIKKNMLYRSYAAEFGPFPVCNTYFNADVTFHMSMGASENGLVGWNERYRFLEDKVPQFVIDRIMEEMEAGNYNY